MWEVYQAICKWLLYSSNRIYVGGMHKFNTHTHTCSSLRHEIEQFLYMHSVDYIARSWDHLVGLPHVHVFK